MTGDLETSAITWGDTRLPYAIRRSARRKKTVAVTVDPAGDVRRPRGSAEARGGSCDRNGTIRIDWRIIQAPMRLVDYMVVHEFVRPSGSVPGGFVS